MKSRAIREKLIEAMAQFEIIDAHEHLGPEEDRVATEVDVFTLFSHYMRGDLAAAGMGAEVYQSLSDQSIPLERRWAIFAPYWERIRWGSYAKAALLAVRRFYGFEDINEQTYIPLTEAMRTANKPGIYERVLGEACHIRTALTQPLKPVPPVDLGTPRLTSVMRDPLMSSVETRDDVFHPPIDPQATIHSLDDYLDTLRRFVARVKAEGAVGLKMMSYPCESPSREKALEAFESLRDGRVASLPMLNPLREYVTNEIIEFAGQQGLVIAVHAGYWGDFRKLNPTHLIPLLFRYPKVRFDLYHLGYPYIREALMLGKQFPNVWLNFCWTHIISQRFATDALDEAIDLIPMNKILAFGGDYALPVEKVYGHLVMARENIASVLAKRVAQGQMTETQALDLAHKWFWENPNELYQLGLPL